MRDEPLYGLIGNIAYRFTGDHLLLSAMYTTTTKANGRVSAIRGANRRRQSKTTHRKMPTKEPTPKRPRPKRDINDLTAREAEVMWLIVRGLSNKAIGESLGIASHTAKFHVSNAVAKFGSTRTQAAVRFLMLNHAEAVSRGMGNECSTVSTS